MGRYDTDYDDDELDERGGNDSSSAMRQLRQAKKADEKRIKELEDKLNEALRGQRERSVKDVLTSKGLNPKIAAFVPSDLTDEASIQKWIDDYADVFGAPAGDAQPTVNEQDAASLQAMDQTMAGGQSPIGQAALIERVKTMPIEELEALIAGSAQ